MGLLPRDRSHPHVPLCSRWEALPCQGCQQRNPACSLGSSSPALTHLPPVSALKTKSVVPSGDFAVCFSGHPQLCCAVCGTRLCVCSQQKSLKPLCTNSLLFRLRLPGCPGRNSRSLLCCSQMPPPGAAAFPQPLPSRSHQPHVGENSVLVEI